MKRTESYSLRAVARMLDCSGSYVTRQVNRGRLRAVIRPSAGGRPWIRVSRDELARWLLTTIQPDYIRKILNPSGDLILCGCQPSLQTALSQFSPTVAVANLFQLGVEVTSRETWGVVIDLTETGLTITTNSILDFARKTDRPELIGLVGDDAAGFAHHCFDVLLPASQPPEKLAKAVQKLRPERG